MIGETQLPHSLRAVTRRSDGCVVRATCVLLQVRAYVRTYLMLVRVPRARKPGRKMVCPRTREQKVDENAHLMPTLAMAAFAARATHSPILCISKAQIVSNTSHWTMEAARMVENGE